MDDVFCGFCIPKICAYNGVCEWVGKLILQASTIMSFRVMGMMGKKKIYSANVVGTTYSGHPTKTTLGNSARVMFYVCYALDKIGEKDVFTGKNPKVKVFVAGDDCIIFCTDDIKENF